MTDEQLLQIAGEQISEKSRGLGKIVRRSDSDPKSADEKGSGAKEDPALLAALQSLLKISLPKAPAGGSDSADVVYEELRDDGVSAQTVVQIRGGKVVRKIRRG